MDDSAPPTEAEHQVLKDFLRTYRHMRAASRDATAGFLQRATSGTTLRIWHTPSATRERPEALLTSEDVN